VSRFHNKMLLEPDDNYRTATLARDLIYDSDLAGRIIVPAKFSTDFASVPRGLWNIFPPLGRYSPAAVVHDYLYRTQTRSRKLADDVFLEAMRVCGCNWFTCRTLWSAVRSFGWLAWKNNQTKLLRA
jgi:hypothetical protein